MTKNIIKYTLIAVLAALSIALNYLKIPITTNVIVTVYAIPLLFAGCCFNFLGSLLVGLITGVVLQLISPYGITVTSPFWALAPIGWTLSSFFMNKLFIKLHPAIRSLIIVVVASLAATALNTFAMLTECWLIADPYYTYALIASELPARLLVMAIMIIPYSLLLFPLVDRVGPLYKKHFEKEASQSLESEAPSEIDE
ncbi:MAG: hypothetical protein J6W25_02955 [Bacilli bacterium]|nr:hypothetical protein [Bacilli bacterium]